MNLKLVMILILQLSLFPSGKIHFNQANVKTDNLLQYVIRESKEDLAKSPILILLHGHGSNEKDLFALNTQIPQNWTVISIRAPFKLAENSYNWYDVKMINGKININLEQEEISRNKIMELISYLIEKHEFVGSKIVVAGFSQGANMAQLLGLSKPSLFSGFGVFSGRYVEEFTPFISKPAELNQTKAFISHGNADHLLPKTYAEENTNKLKALGIETTICEDENGHSISTKQWQEFSKWLVNFK